MNVPPLVSNGRRGPQVLADVPGGLSAAETTTAQTLLDLAELQRRALLLTGAGVRGRGSDPYAYVEEGLEFARRRGAEPLGVGSSRIVVALEDVPGSPRLAAKLAWNLFGLAHNLNEAAGSLAYPEPFRRRIAPVHAISSELVVIVERAEPLSASTDLRAGWLQEDRAEADRVRAEIGPSDEMVRNWGRDRDGRLVLLDYAATLAPRAAVAWAHRNSRHGLLTIDEAAADRYDRRARPRAPVEPRLSSLAERAGWTTSDRCVLCGYGESFPQCCGALFFRRLWFRSQGKEEWRFWDL